MLFSSFEIMKLHDPLCLSKPCTSEARCTKPVLLKEGGAEAGAGAEAAEGAEGDGQEKAGRRLNFRTVSMVLTF